MIGSAMTGAMVIPHADAEGQAQGWGKCDGRRGLYSEDLSNGQVFGATNIVNPFTFQAPASRLIWYSRPVKSIPAQITTLIEAWPGHHETR
jgi:hypothetical protein